MSSAAVPVEIIPGYRESHSGIERKPFAFPPESLFAFSQESCSSSPRNRFHVHPGIPFALPRNPHSTSVRFCRGANGISTVHTLRTLSLSHQAVNKERRSIADAAITDRRESVPSPRCQCACFRGRCKAFARCERSVRRKRMGPAGEDFIHLPQQL
jgi:hypothetical protein